MFTFSDVLRDVGLRTVAAKTNRSLRQIYKWERNNTLPRSDYTGETKFALAISNASNGKYTEEQILNAAMPGRKAYSLDKNLNGFRSDSEIENMTPCRNQAE